MLSRRGRSSAAVSISWKRFLPRFGINVTFVDGRDLDAWRAAIREETKLVFLESLSNPTLELIDIAAVSDLAHAVGALVVADNVFATPIFQRSLELGADIVVYSATKHIDGQGTMPWRRRLGEQGVYSRCS